MSVPLPTPSKTLSPALSTMKRSLPLPPNIMSAPPRPSMKSLPPAPSSRLAPPLPVYVPFTAAVTVMLRFSVDEVPWPSVTRNCIPAVRRRLERRILQTQELGLGQLLIDPDSHARIQENSPLAGQGGNLVGERVVLRVSQGSEAERCLCRAGLDRNCLGRKAAKAFVDVTDVDDDVLPVKVAMRVGDDDLDGVGSGRLEVQRPVDADLAIVGIDAERAGEGAAGGRLQV